MPSPSEQVTSTFSLAQTYATSAMAGMVGFTNALNLAAQNNTVPTISFGWNTPDAPALPLMPPLPAMPTIEYLAPDNMPEVFDEVMPGIAIDTFIPVMPSVTLPDAPVLNFGVAPVIPGVAAVTVPDAPDLVLPEVPEFLALSTITLADVNMHEDWLTRLETIPTLSLLAPTPYSYARGPEYASELMAKLKAVLSERINGGTGLDPAVEQALFDRARSRELRTSQANEAEIMRSGDALGYALPPGVLVAQRREAQQNYYDKASGLSRDIMVKQAELEQANLKDTIAAGMSLEGQLIDYSLKLEQLSFESARALAENALATHNASIAEFQALLKGYETYAGAYDTLIKAEMSKVEVFKAKLAGEQAKADVNRSLADQYKSQVEASLATVEVYKAQVGAAQTLIELEQAKIAAAGEQVRGYVAQVNAETSKIEAYKAQVQGEVAKTEMYSAQASAYASRAQVQAELARANISRYTAISQAKTAEWDGYRARIGAESTRIEALGKQSGALLDGFRAQASAVEAQANNNIALWNASVTSYQKGRDILLQTQRINSDNILQTRALQVDAAKAGTQVYAQLASASYGMMNVQASVSGQSQTSVGYNYSGNVSGTVSPLASV